MKKVFRVEDYIWLAANNFIKMCVFSLWVCSYHSDLYVFKLVCVLDWPIICKTSGTFYRLFKNVKNGYIRCIHEYIFGLGVRWKFASRFLCDAFFKTEEPINKLLPRNISNCLFVKALMITLVKKSKSFHLDVKKKYTHFSFSIVYALATFLHVDCLVYYIFNALLIFLK